MRALERLAGQVPESVEAHRELYFYSILISACSLLAHAVFCPLFWYLGLLPMALFNVGSCMVWVFVLTAVRKGRLPVALLMATLEINAHAWAATLCLGMTASFHFYIILLVVVSALLTNFRLLFRLLLGALSILSYVALVIYSAGHLALLPVSPAASAGLAALNSITFMLILGGQCYFYAVSVQRARRSLAENNLRLKEALSRLKEAQDQMVVQQRLAYLGTLTAGVAHEIKNPLNFVKNFAALSADIIPDVKEVTNLIMEGKASPDDLTDFQECLGHLETNNKKIEQHCLRADKVIQSMLLHSGVSSGSLELTDINALLRSSIELARHDKANLDGIQVEIAVELEEALPKAMAIPQDLGRAFLNIIGNAVKAAHAKAQEQGPDFRPRVIISSCHLRAAIQIRITDNGQGIPPGLLERVFNPFFTTRPTGEGTGLGLSIAHDIVVGQHRGRLWVESEEGAYARFCIDLPSGLANSACVETES